MTSYGKDFICDHVRFTALSADSASVTGALTVSGKATAAEVVAAKFCCGGITVPITPTQTFTLGTQVANQTVPNAAATGSAAEINAVATCLKGLIVELQKTGVIGPAA